MKTYSKKLDWVDGIKGFGIIAILLNHFVESFGSGPWFSNPSYNWPAFSARMTTIFPKDGTLPVRIIKFLGWLGDMGPGVFILLSGLTLTISALNKPLKTVDFYRTRLLRIYPLYITIHVIILIVVKLWFKWDIHLTSIRTVLSLLGLRFTGSLFFYINPSWWFIWVIIQLYFVFPFLFILLRKKGISAFLIVTFTITILARICGLLGLSYSNDLYYWMTGIFAGTRLFEFTFGMYLGYLLASKNISLINFLSRKLKVAGLSLSVYVFGFIFSWTYVGSIFSNIFITIGLSGLFYSSFELVFKKNRTVKNTLLWIGKNSFSVFLLHQPFMMYVSPLLKGLQKELLLVVVIFLSFIAGYLIEKTVLYFVKTIEVKKVSLKRFLDSKIYRYIILSTILIAMLLSFSVMLGLEKFNSPLKLVLLMLIAGISIFRLSKFHEVSSFTLRFFDVALAVSVIMFLITENWLSTYWILLTLSSIPLLFTTKLNHFVSVSTMLIILIGSTSLFENYLRKTSPLEVNKWGEFPALQMDSETVYSLIPNKTTHLKYNNYDYYVKTNSYGFASPEIYLLKKAKNEKRILIIGDAFSMPEGMNYESSYPFLLEQLLRKDFPNSTIKVIDAGVTGYGPNEEKAQLSKYIKVIKPDIVINQFFVNEYADIKSSKLERRSSIGFFRNKSFKDKYFGSSQIPIHLKKFAQHILGIVDKPFIDDMSLLSFYEKSSSLYSDSEINKMSDYFDEMNNLSSKNNSRYIVLYVPGQIEVSRPADISYYPYFENLKDTNEFNFNTPQKITDILCKRKHIPFLNTTDYLKNYTAQPVYFKESWHWNKNGHIAIAKYLEEYFLNNKMLISETP